MEETYGAAVTSAKFDRLDHQRTTLHHVPEWLANGGYGWNCNDCEEMREVQRSDYPPSD
jgi:hypothetical protein